MHSLANGSDTIDTSAFLWKEIGLPTHYRLSACQTVWHWISYSTLLYPWGFDEKISNSRDSLSSLNLDFKRSAIYRLSNAHCNYNLYCHSVIDWTVTLALQSNPAEPVLRCCETGFYLLSNAHRKYKTRKNLFSSYAVNDPTKHT